MFYIYLERPKTRNADTIEILVDVVDEGAPDSSGEEPGDPGWGPEFKFFVNDSEPAEEFLKSQGLLEEANGLAADALYEIEMERIYG